MAMLRRPDRDQTSDREVLIEDHRLPRALQLRFRLIGPTDGNVSPNKIIKIPWLMDGLKKLALALKFGWIVHGPAKEITPVMQLTRTLKDLGGWLAKRDGHLVGRGVIGDRVLDLHPVGGRAKSSGGLTV